MRRQFLEKAPLRSRQKESMHPANDSGGVPMAWLGQLFFNRRRVQKRVLIGLASAAILLGVPPAWPQSEGPDAPARGNVLETSSIRESFSRWVRPPTAEAAPRPVYRHHRIRNVKTRQPAEV